MDIRKSLTRCVVAKLIALAVIALATGPAHAATVSVNWSAPSTGRTSYATFGTNDSLCGLLAQAPVDPRMAADMRKIGFRFIRLHGGIAKAWSTNNTWNPKIVKTVLDAPYVKACGDANTLITIDAPPPWCQNADKSINDAEYASFCAKLVKIVNKDLGHHVKNWECLNEPDGWNNRDDASRAHYFRLFNTCAIAMKAVDPTIRVGGPTMMWWNESLADKFLTNCWPNIGFLSWHEYPTGASLVPPLDGPSIYKQVMHKLPQLGNEVGRAKALIAAHRAHGFNDGHPIPLYYGEFNMGWNWVASGWGQDQYVGAAYFGGALTELAHAKIDWSTNWSAKDGYFGLIDMNDQLRPPAYVYMFANHDLIGSMAQSSSDDPDVYCLAVDRGPNAQGDKHAIMLTNTFYKTKTVNLEQGLTAFGLIAHITTVDKTGVHTSTRYINSANSTFVMPGFSVAMITMP